MSNVWVMSVLGPDGTPKASVTVDDKLLSIDSFESDGAGSCGEATFTAVPDAVDIEPRDVIRIDYSVTGEAEWLQPMYRGVVTSAGSPRSPNAQQYRAVGMKQRAYETILKTRIVSGGDIGTVADTVLRAWSLDVVGVNAPLDAFETLGFEIGDRYPQLETVGEFADAIAAYAGAFVVPVGETYAYAGVTYNAGDLVPRVVWGVGPSGLLFFHRPTGATRTFDEAEAASRVTWQPREAEEVSDHVTFVYAPEYAEGTIVRYANADANRIGYPIAFTVGDGDIAADRRVELVGPIDYMADEATAGSGSGDVVNAANAFDGDPATAAVFGAVDSGVLTVNAGHSFDSPNEVKHGAIVEVEYTGNQNQRGINDYNLKVDVRYVAAGGVLLATLTQFVSTTEEATRQSLYVTALVPAAVTATIQDLEVTVRGAEGVEVSRIRIWVPDSQVAERLAQAFEQPARTDVALIEYDGLLEDDVINGPFLDEGTPEWSRPRAVVTLLDDSEVDLRIERIERSITSDGGAAARVYLGQAFEADLEAQRIMLERLARRVARDGQRRQLR